jgi:hypothetical protein
VSGSVFEPSVAKRTSAINFVLLLTRHRQVSFLPPPQIVLAAFSGCRTCILLPASSRLNHPVTQLSRAPVADAVISSTRSPATPARRVSSASHWLTACRVGV